MHVYGPTHLDGAQRIGPPHTSRAPKPAQPDYSAPIQDELDISDAGRLADQVRALPEIRQDRVDEIRAQITAGTYETDDKLEIALGRLLDEIG
jgi:anti-sigma28 factor (negative regulator of flagellin synthesis)